MKRRNLACRLLPAMLVTGLPGGCAKSVDQETAENNLMVAPEVEAIRPGVRQDSNIWRVRRTA